MEIPVKQPEGTIAAKGGCLAQRLEIEINSSAQVALISFFTSARFDRTPRSARVLMRFSASVLLLLVGVLEKSLDLFDPAKRLSHLAGERFELGEMSVFFLVN